MTKKYQLPAEHRLTKFLAASLGLAVTGIATSNAANSTWTGATDQDFFTGTNWSAGVPNAAGNVGTINTSAGNTPIISTTNNFGTNVDVEVGKNTGNTGLLTQSAGTVTSTGWWFVGRDGGTGTFNQTGGTLNLGRLFVGAGGGTTGTFTQSAGATVTLTGDFWQANGGGAAVTGTSNIGGTLNIGGVGFISHSDNNATQSTGTMNVNSGGVVNAANDVLISFAGSNLAQGTLNVEAGGTFNIGTTTEKWLFVNNWDAANGALNVGGTVNLNAGTDIISHGQDGTGNAVINVDGGSILGTGAVGMTDSSKIKLHAAGGQGADTVTIQNGGVAQLGQIVNLVGGTGTATVNFDGGTLKALENQAALINLAGAATSSINILAGGATIDSNGFAVGISQIMSGAGSLTKAGAGTLTLGGAQAYLGDTIISAGTLSINTGYLADASNVWLSSGGVFDLNFGGTDTINALYFDGIAQNIGTWGAIGSGAQFESNFFTGTGLLSVTVPEPGTYALAVAALLGVVAAGRRRRKA